MFLAWLVALLASLAVLFVGEVMGQAPCTLCWFQRAFMFPLAIILGLACFRGDSSGPVYGIVLACGGGLVSGFHSLVYAGIVPEAIQPCSVGGPSCSGSDMTILGGMPLPFLALAAFLAIALFLAYGNHLSREKSST
ncbi:disulfide bond formation protein B [Zavarzinia sp. CC-PAN008]|uniref:disulfide bond formation protein B n=1 Tax=Zavarzinia sp. CC-PAN008 TaxID=3243332 RepID=UPI003F7454BA